MANFNPRLSSSSAVRTPGPPALVIMATLFPLGKGCENALAMLSISSIVFATKTPLCLNAASYIFQLPAKEPVWLDAALAPLSLFPAFKAMIGFFFVTLFATSMNFFPFLTPSMYRAIALSSSVSAKYSISSAKSTSAMLPTLMNFENPMSSFIVLYTIPAPNAPLWLMNATFPFLATVIKVAFKSTWVFIIPTQFGPMILIPYLWAISTSSFSSLFPSSPVSPNPAVIITTPLTPFSPHWISVSFTNLFGTTIIAKSISSGISLTLLYALTP
ncbi:272aa long hypothetical protein [Pyrococcus horikoshii OT3]|uniref:Uncharacterized protein n=1 Tax=Pyrococcus horikoshii (strain ATCC 700860 / DSM 12428 / JCM 9974 / NBRC 100139 / OT-3) TaxID=70601 RepID=O58494_PYRHO|nr:272aa long hypothetical protein [Pyrococcus horikoshii OT3]